MKNGHTTRGAAPAQSNMLNTIVKFFVGLCLFIYRVIEQTVRRWLPASWIAKDITGELVVITGAGLGIGRIMAQKFAARGAKIAALDINQEAVEETAKLIRKAGGTVNTYICDVSNRQGVYDTMDRIKREMGTCNILVNNAGIVCGKRVIDESDEMIEKTFQVNAIGHFWFLKKVLPDMAAANHGHIVSIASIVGHIGIPYLVDYCASKYAARGIQEALLTELAAENYDGIKITTVCPYFIDTGMFHGVDTGLVPFLDPEYVADQAVWATLTEKPQIVLPPYLTLITILKMIIPSKADLIITKAIGLNQTMHSFAAHARPQLKKKN